VIFFALTLLLISCGGINYNTFSDQKNGFEIDYPADWDTTNLDARMVFMAREDFEDSTDLFTEGFSISVYDNEGVALEEIVNQNVAMAEYYFQDTEIKRENFTTKSDINGIRLELIYDADGLKLLNRASFFENNGKLYTITQSVEASKREDYDEIFEAILNSLTWVD